MLRPRAPSSLDVDQKPDLNRKFRRTDFRPQSWKQECLICRTCIQRVSVIMLFDGPASAFFEVCSAWGASPARLLFDGPASAFFEVCSAWGASPARSSLPSCSRPSRTLRAADAVARRRAILDRRCARRHARCAGRDGRMAPVEQKDGREKAADALLSSRAGTSAAFWETSRYRFRHAVERGGSGSWKPAGAIWR